VRRSIRFAVLVTAMAALTACAGGDGGADTALAGSVGAGPAAFAASPVGAQDGGVVSGPGITVVGIGEVRGRPDTLSLSAGVMVTRRTVSAATADAATAADEVIGALVANGVAREDIQTRDYAIYPQYSPQTSPDAPPKITGYTVTNVVVARLRDLANAGAVIDAVAAAGGDEVTIHGVSFSLEDAAPLVAAARERAWSDARTKAADLARLAGVPLGAAVQITETQQGQPIPLADRAMASEAGGTTPIEPGQVTSSVVVTVRFALG
jgi:hypothetical protein